MSKKHNENEQIKFFFYFTIASLYVFATYNDWETYLSDRLVKAGLTYQITYGGRMKFLTFIDMVINTSNCDQFC